MNQRNSSGLPLRAMVMVLLFLGVVFLLVGFQAMSSDDSDNDQSSIATTTITTTTSPPTSPAPAKADVRVYNISSTEGAAENTASALGLVGARVEGDLKRFKKFIEERGAATGQWRGEIHGQSVQQRSATDR